MKHFKSILLGTGMSSLVYLMNSKKKIKVFTAPGNNFYKRNNFYENDKLGGNSNIWGGYINYKRHKKFLNNRKYSEIFKKNIFKTLKIFNSNSLFSNTYCLVDKDQKIFRVKKQHFGKISNGRIEKIIIKKNFLILKIKKKFISTNNLNLCIGNLSLIKLLSNSNLIKPEDIISYDDGKCNYVINCFVNQKNNYYIPMPIVKIFEKLIFRKTNKYELIDSTFILQKFSGKISTHRIRCKDLLKKDKFKFRYFLSNHVVNLKVNNIPIRKFIFKKSGKINIYCSGTIKKYLPGPIIQDMIFDVVKK